MGLVKQGHRQAVEALASEGFSSIRTLFEEAAGTRVDFRPTGSGLRPVDLDVAHPKPMLGLGPAFGPRVGATEISAGMARRLEALQTARSGVARPSIEQQFEAQLVDDALANALRIRGLPDRYRLLCSQWRMPAEGAQPVGRLDLLAADLETGSLVVVELKERPDVGAFDQARDYLGRIEAHRDELVPFFSSLADAMGKAYGAPDMCEVIDDAAPVCAIVGWLSGDEIDWFVLDDPPASVADDLHLHNPREPWLRARLRLHQSWWRRDTLRRPAGTGPKATSATTWGNMLDAQGAAEGGNYLTKQIRKVADDRLQGSSQDIFRCERNLLSSQPMCFNLFGPLVGHNDRAARLLNGALPGSVTSVEEVIIEWPRKPRPTHLIDGSAMDAMAVATIDGVRTLVSIETKLSEPFSQQHYDRTKYFAKASDFPDVFGAELDPSLGDIRWFQLWRNHLLAEVHAGQAGSGFGQVLQLVVRHPLDTDAKRHVATYRSLLADPSRVLDLPLDVLLDGFEQHALPDEQRWLADFRARYVDLSGSEDLWRQSLGARRLVA